jgi:hypothetical protein
MKVSIRLVGAGALLFLLAAIGCSSPGRTNNAILSTGLAIATFTPNAEIEQIYYLGVIDPIEQVPEAIYRVRVRGQASAMSETKFASGWVPAWTIDALNGQSSGVDAAKNRWLQQRCDKPETCIPTVGRGLVQFGPEGFREAPRDHRLVIVMGADPSKFFQAIDKTLATISDVKLDKQNAGIRKEMNAALSQLREDQVGLKEIQIKVLEEGLK